MLNLHTKAPDFSLPDQDGHTYHLYDHLGDKYLVIYFYPRDNTGGCTAEACSFRDHYEEFLAQGCEVVGISDDDESSHREFAGKHALPFRLLSDYGNAVRKKYKATGSLMGILPGRVTYVLNPKGAIIHAFKALMQFEEHVDQALAAIRKDKPAGK